MSCTSVTDPESMRSTFISTTRQTLARASSVVFNDKRSTTAWMRMTKDAVKTEAEAAETG